ncbi:TIGR02117 family protein [Fischerella sp. PCC 9605]|uniref:TIGR02117 family protein n=1 Tax=Fischerella sp. PCC 9605 TaxID=1173024 RepID=UPI0004796533|nr:TIGR02117 family protein [Fischerella sp. PCC 9605]
MKFTNNLVFIRLLYRLTSCFLGVVLFGFALLAISAFVPRKWMSYSKDNCELKICISNTGIHSNIIVPTKNNVFDWHNYIYINEVGIDTTQDYNYLSFGWGDRDFYMSTPSLADLKLSTTLKALFLPTPSVMHVKGYQRILDNLEVKCVRVNKDDYLQLMEYIQTSFKVDAKGKKIRLGNGHTSNAGFYGAVGSYSILKNCNSWTAVGLRKADVNTPLWDGLSSAIMLHLKDSCD